MTMRYVKDPRSVILAVMPANVDMTTSDALQLARQVHTARKHHLSSFNLHCHVILG